MSNRNRFRIQPLGWGVIYATKYASTAAGAVNQARKSGWRELHSDSSDTRPLHAEIYERTSDGAWELVAKVSPKGIDTIDCIDRRSFKLADATITKMRSVMARVADTMAQFNVIANKDYAKEKDCD